MAKFMNIGDTEMADVYGYRFRPGEVVDVVEENLIAKFVNYGWLEVANGLQEQGKGRQAEIPGTTTEAGPVDRAALKARADELGIPYFARIKTVALQNLVEQADGSNEDTTGE